MTGSRIDLARALIGVGVRAGAASPDLSTPDTFKAALLKARTVSYVNPAAGGTSGTYFEGLLKRMGSHQRGGTQMLQCGVAVGAGIAHGHSLPRGSLVFAGTPLRWRWNLLRLC